jgi:hypothetical protein
MTDRELNDLENENNWDFDKAFEHPASTSGRAVIPVAFEREEFERLAAFARSRGVTISACIHDMVVYGLSGAQPEVNADSSDVAHDPLD